MRILLGSLFALLVSFSAIAGDIPNTGFRHGNWVGSAHTNLEGRFSNCTVYASYKNGDRLYFSVNADGTITVALANQGFRLVDGESFPVTLKVDRRSPFRGQAVALGRDFAILTIEDFDRALAAFRKGFVLTIDSGNRQGVYGLKGTYRALELANKCVTFWTDEEVTKLNMGQGVFWDAPSANLIGGVYLRPASSDRNLQATDAEDLQQITGPCTGDILSGARKVEAGGVPTRELRAICSMEDLVQETIVSKVQFDDVIVYTLLLFSDPKAPSEAVEQDRRQMSEDVITRAASFLVSSD